MDITVSNYHRDLSENGLKTFLAAGRIGILHLESGKKTMPAFDRVIISSKYIFVETKAYWGILNLDLSLVLSPICKEIFPVNKIDRDYFISNCQSNQGAVSITLDSNNGTPTHVAIQTKEINTDKIYEKYGEGLFPSFYKNAIDEEDKAIIYEVTKDLENVRTNLFVTILDDDTQLIDVDKREIMCDTGFKGYNFFPLWHYKDNMFIVRNKNGSYVTSTYKKGRFTKKSLWGEYDDSFEEYGSPKVVVLRDEFISVCYPVNYRFIGSPFTNQEQEKEFAKKKGKWALFKYRYAKHKNDVKRWRKYLPTESSWFEQLTSYAFEEPITQLQDNNEFICHGADLDFLMKFEHRIVERNDALEVDEIYETKPCSQGQLNIIACYNSIDQREDGMFDVTTKSGCGLCDKDMSVLVPAQYDFTITDWEEQLVIVRKQGKYGVINKDAEEIVPCKYDYIQIGKDYLPIWNWDCKWDSMLVDAADKCSINNKIDIIPSDDDLIREGYIIVGIILEMECFANPKTLADKLNSLRVKIHGPRVLATHCDIFFPNGKFITECVVSKLAEIKYNKEEGLLVVSDRSNFLNTFKIYGVYICKSSAPVLTSKELSDAPYSISGNSSEGYCDLEEIIITKDVNKVEWNGLGRWQFRKFNVASENKVFCEVDGVLYTQKGYDRNGCTDRKQMIELVACPTNVRSHDVIHGTKRIANCAFKGSLIETLNLPDTLEEIGVNAFYMTPNLKHLKLPLSIRKIESQDVGMSGDASPSIEYNGQNFTNWEALYEYMLRSGFEKKNGNIVKRM